MADTTYGSTVEPFERDAAEHGGYQYTTDRLSSRLANARISDAVLAAASFDGARVIDIGCGDGTYTREIASLAHPAKVHGVDPAAAAIDVARQASRDEELVSFDVASAYELPHEADAFDVAILRGVLHHVDRPGEAIGEALRVAPTLVVMEPNGLNAGLKLLERFSSYHVEHEERSYAPGRLDIWVDGVGGRVIKRQFVGFVPMFAPDGYARFSKRLEPLLEATPGVRRVTCAQYVFTAGR